MLFCRNMLIDLYHHFDQYQLYRGYQIYWQRKLKDSWKNTQLL